MSYQLLILRRAQKELAGLHNSDYERVRDKIALLVDDPRPAGCKKLVGRESWRIRVGNYRVIYDINDASPNITILHVGHRSDLYS